MRPLLALFAALTCLMYASGPTAAQGAGSHSFRPETHLERTHVYRLVSTGSVSVEGPQPHVVTFQLSVEAAVQFGTPDASGMIPLRITFGRPETLGLDTSVADALRSAEISGTLLSNGALAEVYTPPVLEELGLDLGDLIIGLVVPRPEDPGASSWSVSYPRARRSAAVPRSTVLEGTFTPQGLRDWGTRILSSVTARLRGEATVRQGTVTNQIEEIGHALYYLDPDTGATEMSSVSIVTNIRSAALSRAEVRTRITLTTTLERRRDREPRVEAPSIGAQPASPGPAAGEPAEAQPGQAAPSEPESSEAEHVAPALGQPDAPEPEPLPSQPSGDDTGEPTGETPDATSSEAPVPHGTEQGGAAQEQQAPAGTETMSPQAPQDEPNGEEPAVEEPAPGDSEIPGTEPAEQESTGQEPPGAGEDRHIYVDPAGRFALELPPGWPSSPSRISLRGTAFEPPSSEAAYVYVLPVPSAGASAAGVARSAIATYQETQPGFTLVLEPRPTTLGGQAAYEAFYRYDGDGGIVVSEWGAFTRWGDRAYYVQYAREGVHEPEPLPREYRMIKESFSFGPTPEGAVDAARLADSLELYIDTVTGYRLLVPSLWPLADEADDGSSVTFVEIGERGYLTVFSRDGANGLQARDIIAAWRNEWAKEPGFRLIRDLYEVRVDGRRGVGLEYRWLGEGDSGWTRRLIALVDANRLYVVVVDYVSSGFEARRETFDRILSSFDLIDPGETPQPSPEPERGDEPAASAPGSSAGDADPTPAPEDTGAPSSPQAAPAADWPFAEPVGEESVLLLGRLLTRYRPGGDGPLQEEWAANSVVYVRVGSDVYTGVTDEHGHIFVSNLPRLAGGQFYEVTRVQGRLFGFDRTVAITFQNLQAGQLAPRVAYLGVVEVALEPDGRLTVDVGRPAGEDAASRSSLDHFARTYPASGWAPFVREAILVRDRM